jgi:MFS family permease
MSDRLVCAPPSASETPFYGWTVLAAAFVIITMSIGMLFTLAIFLKPMEEAMGWSRSSISSVGLLNWVVMGLGGVLAGFVSDRIGTRAVVLVGSGLLGLGLVLSSQVTALWQLYVTFGILVAGGVSAFYVPLTVLAIKWFGDRRGMAASVVSAGNGAGILLLSPLTRWLVNEMDWRMAFLILGDLAWLVVIPAALLLRDAPPARDGLVAGQRPLLLSAGASTWPPLSPRGGQPIKPPLSPHGGRPAGLLLSPHGGLPAVVRPGAIFRSWPFWAIALTHFACCAAHSGPIFHLVTHAIDQGVARMSAASLLGLSGLSSIFGRVGTGIVADRVGAKPTLIAALALQALTVFAFLFVRDLGPLSALTFVFGIAYGASMPLYALVTREYFGEQALGAAFGAVFFISCIGMGLGSYGGGFLYDALGSYAWLFLTSGTVGTMAVVMASGLQPPAPARALAA